LCTHPAVVISGTSPENFALVFAGLSFKVEEIVQAWNEMYDAKKRISGAPSFRLEPIFRRRAPKLHHILEHIQYT
jgi:hypothetical protein